MTKTWEEHREVIMRLYKEQNRPLSEVIHIMESKYSFKASVRAYRSRLKKWKVSKYNMTRRNSLAIDMASPSGEDAALGYSGESSYSPAMSSVGPAQHVGGWSNVRMLEQHECKEDDSFTEAMSEHPSTPSLSYSPSSYGSQSGMLLDNMGIPQADYAAPSLRCAQFSLPVDSLRQRAGFLENASELGYS